MLLLLQDEWFPAILNAKLPQASSTLCQNMLPERILHQFMPYCQAK